ncbi:MAG TPA: hypothetical protein VNE82_02180 [Candidatus Binataceae bacterium]|nr:hypothetical protein [Candidatus Binataceae bacterium]
MAAYAVWRSLSGERPGAPSSVNDSARQSKNDPPARGDASAAGNRLLAEVTEKVLPARGLQSRIRLGASVVKLVEKGIIDRQKFEALYEGRGGLPRELERILVAPSANPILLTRGNAGAYVNLLWPLGLSNHMSTNDQSPLNGKSLSAFASTGGWNLGRAQNGGEYFNRFGIVALRPEQEALVTRIARNTYRPCCNNSTFFQDCNHGSALLGVLELGASQGLPESELYREALAFNSFWFPRNYVETALYFRVVKKADWHDLDPKEILGFEYSAAGPWAENVHAKLARMPDVLPQAGSAACSL